MRVRSRLASVAITPELSANSRRVLGEVRMVWELVTGMVRLPSPLMSDDHEQRDRVDPRRRDAFRNGQSPQPRSSQLPPRPSDLQRSYRGSANPQTVERQDDGVVVDALCVSRRL